MPSAPDIAREVPAAYNDKVVRQFAFMTVVWGIVGMLVGVIIAAQLIWPNLNFDLPFLSYGRLRPLHTNAGICCPFSSQFCINAITSCCISGGIIRSSTC